MKNLQPFFNPKSVAVIGASQNMSSINGMLVKYLVKHNYKGDVFPVNPKYKEVAGFKCYPQLTDIQEDVDMVLLAISANKILPALDQCVQKGVKAVIIYSSGFAEIGDYGAEIQNKIEKVAENGNIAICGPNVLGSVNVLDNVAMGFSPVLDYDLIKGSVGFISQSGAFGFVTFHQAQEERVGFSYLVTTGNEVDLSLSDFIEFMVEDDKTKAIVCYMEGLKEGDKFKKAVQKSLEADKPIIVFKVGKSAVGQKAVSSHTAALSGSDNVFDAYVKQKGIIRVEDSDALIDMAKIFTNQRRPKGKNVGILSTSGGAGIMAADIFSQYSINIPELEKEVRVEIEKNIPVFGSALNPVDVTAQVFNEIESFSKCLHILADAANIDCILISISTVGGEVAIQVAKEIIKVYKATEKPIAVSWGASDKLAGEAFSILNQADIPLYKQPVRCARALSALMNYKSNRSKLLQYEDHDRCYLEPELVTSVKEFISSIANNELTEAQAKQVLAKIDLPVTREILIQGEEEAKIAAQKIGYPVALKVMSSKILHKTEAGVIELNIEDEHNLLQAYQRISQNALNVVKPKDIQGILVQEMVLPGIEIIFGVKNDSQFGPIIMFGLGGIFVEILMDVSSKITPLTRQDAYDMLKEIKSNKILDGYRGQPPANKELLVDIILKLSQLAYQLKDVVAELDLNPVMVYPDDVKVLDALIIKK